METQEDHRQKLYTDSNLTPEAVKWQCCVLTI